MGNVHRNEHSSHSFHSYLGSKDTYLELEDFLREQGFIFSLSGVPLREDNQGGKKPTYFFLSGKVFIYFYYIYFVLWATCYGT